MIYADKADYAGIYGEVPDELRFTRAAAEASRLCDVATATADGVYKLRLYMPEGEGGLEVRGCVCELADALMRIEDAVTTAAAARGRVEDEDGLHGGVIASVSAGNEFISYKSTSSTKSVVEHAAEDGAAKDAWLRSIIERRLSGVLDKNGVPLLYGGRYDKYRQMT